MTVDRITESLEEFIKRFRNPLQLFDFVLNSSSEAVELSLIRNDTGEILWMLLISPESIQVMKASFNEKDYVEIVFNSEFEFFYKFIILFAPIYSKIGKGGLNSILSKLLSKEITNWASYLLTLSEIIGEGSVKVLQIDPYTVKIGENTFFYDGERATIQNPVDISISVESITELFSMASVFFDLVLTLSEVEDFNFFLQNSIKDIEEAYEEYQEILEDVIEENPYSELPNSMESIFEANTNLEIDTEDTPDETETEIEV